MGRHATSVSDKAGKPLVSGFSCHDDTTGSTHLPCIIKNAGQKSKQSTDLDLAGFCMPWVKFNK
jgi:hypothetical protein